MINLVLLDVNLLDGLSYPVAVDAKRRAIPLVFLTSYDTSFIEPAHRDVRVMSKPFQTHEVESLLKDAA